jgi:2-dehydro-3-deoxyphosphogluconate aldolase/(4S)-4-hydroxy-2-oxoglutarate aldolase
MTEVREMVLRSAEPIAIVRLDDLGEAVAIGQALVEGGIRALEFTLTNPDALNSIGEVRGRLEEGRALVGAGTVLDGGSAGEAISAGAQFLVTPVYRRDVIERGLEGGVPVVSGAMSPTEIFAAWQDGADLVKVFPARSLGPSYVKDLLGPLPQLRLVPTGGVNLDNCAEFIEAGAYTVALGSNLVDEAVISRRDWVALSAQAERYVEACAAASPRG